MHMVLPHAKIWTWIHLLFGYFMQTVSILNFLRAILEQRLFSVEMSDF